MQAEVPPAVALVGERGAERNGSELVDRAARNRHEETQHPRVRQRNDVRMGMRQAQEIGLNHQHRGRGDEPRERESHERERETTLRREPAARLWSGPGS